MAYTAGTIGSSVTGTLGSGVNIKPAINASGDAPIYACRAWVNFNGTGTVAIRSSGNVSSITDHSTGTYSVVFDENLEDAEYSVTASSIGSTVGYGARISGSNSVLAVTSCKFECGNHGGALEDVNNISVMAIR